MKIKGNLVLILLSFFVLLSCSDDESPNENAQMMMEEIVDELGEPLDNTAENLLGSWILTDISDFNGESFSPFRSAEANEIFTISFNEDFLVTDSRFECDGSFNLMDNHLFRDFSCVMDMNGETGILGIFTEVLVLLEPTGDEATGLRFSRN